MGVLHFVFKAKAPTGQACVALGDKLIDGFVDHSLVGEVCVRVPWYAVFSFLHGVFIVLGADNHTHKNTNKKCDVAEQKQLVESVYVWRLHFFLGLDF